MLQQVSAQGLNFDWGRLSVTVPKHTKSESLRAEGFIVSREAEIMLENMHLFENDIPENGQTVRIIRRQDYCPEPYILGGLFLQLEKRKDIPGFHGEQGFLNPWYLIALMQNLTPDDFAKWKISHLIVCQKGKGVPGNPYKGPFFLALTIGGGSSTNGKVALVALPLSQHVREDVGFLLADGCFYQR